MIVALETAHGGTEKGLADSIDHVIQIDLTSLRGECHGRIPRTHAQERGGHQQLRIALDPRLSLPQLIAGQLLDDELVVGFVFIEGTNDIITIAPGIGAFVIVGIAACVSITRNVQPVLSPALTVMRAGQ